MSLDVSAKLELAPTERPYARLKLSPDGTFAYKHLGKKMKYEDGVMGTYEIAGMEVSHGPMEVSHGLLLSYPLDPLWRVDGDGFSVALVLTTRARLPFEASLIG